jgi:hypothetical protein
MQATVFKVVLEFDDALATIDSWTMQQMLNAAVRAGRYDSDIVKELRKYHFDIPVRPLQPNLFLENGRWRQVPADPTEARKYNPAYNLKCCLCGEKHDWTTYYCLRCQRKMCMARTD